MPKGLLLMLVFWIRMYMASFCDALTSLFDFFLTRENIGKSKIRF